MFLFVGLCVMHTHFLEMKRSPFFFSNWNIWHAIDKFFLAMHHPISNEIVWNMNERLTLAHRDLLWYAIQSETHKITSDCSKLSSANRMTVSFFNHFSFVLSGTNEVVQNWFIAERIMRTFFSWIFTFFSSKWTKIKEKTTVNTIYQCSTSKCAVVNNSFCRTYTRLTTQASLSLFTFSENKLKQNLIALNILIGECSKKLSKLIEKLQLQMEMAENAVLDRVRQTQKLFSASRWFIPFLSPWISWTRSVLLFQCNLHRTSIKFLSNLITCGVYKPHKKQSYFFSSWDILMAYVLWTDIDLTLFLEPHTHNSTNSKWRVENEHWTHNEHTHTHTNTWVLTRNKTKNQIESNPIHCDPMGAIDFFSLVSFEFQCEHSLCEITISPRQSAILHQYIDCRSAAV